MSALAGVPTADHGLTDEQRAFVEAHPRLRRREAQWTADGEDAHNEDVASRMGELGWYGLQIPEEYGGSGGSFFDATLFLEETARGQIPVAAYGVTLIVVGALEALRHRGAEAPPATATWSRAARSRSRCRSPRRARTWPT